MRNRLIGHWMIVLLVAMQVLVNGPMQEAFGTLHSLPSWVLLLLIVMP